MNNLSYFSYGEKLDCLIDNVRTEIKDSKFNYVIVLPGGYYPDFNGVPLYYNHTQDRCVNNIEQAELYSTEKLAQVIEYLLEDNQQEIQIVNITKRLKQDLGTKI